MGGTQGDLVKHNGTNFARFTKGAAYQIPRVNSTATDLEYAALEVESAEADFLPQLVRNIKQVVGSNSQAIPANWIQANTGTGNVTFNYAASVNFMLLATGAASGSVAEATWPIASNGVAANSFFSCAASLGSALNGRTVVGFFIGAPSADTVQGYGFRAINNGNVFAINGNGTAATTTNLGIIASTTRIYTAIYQGNSIKFYVNGSLMATHTTNLPTLIYGVRAYITNTIASDYNMALYCPIVAGVSI
jgi:hypothetical protein